MKIPSPDELALSLLSVQPMPDNTLQGLLEVMENEADLIRDGYEPVSELNLLWVKASKETK